MSPGPSWGVLRSGPYVKDDANIIDHMCGRFVGSFSTGRIVDELGSDLHELGLTMVSHVDGNPFEERPNYNFAPTQTAPTLVCDEGTVDIATMTWGLVPRWAKDASRASSMINARSETVMEKPSFKGLLKSHRCVVPMDGFYEWDRSDPGNKIPHFCSRRDGKLMLVAGLWTTSPALGGTRTFCILTRESRGDLSSIHDRCPVHLTAHDALRWISETTPPLELAHDPEQPLLVTRRVSKRVNSVRNNDPELLLEADGEAGTQASPSNPTLF